MFNTTIKAPIKDTPSHKTWMILLSSCSCLCPIHWSQVLSREWRCSWSSANRRCSNYIWVIKNFIAHKGVTYIRGLTVRTNDDTLSKTNNVALCTVCTMFIGQKTRRSENDNNPQPLDQWTNSPFIGQQVGNCKSFTFTHYLADLFAMHRSPRSIPLCIQHHIQLTSLSFQVSQTSNSSVTAISIFYLENPRSRSWVRSKFEVTMWV